MAKNPADGIIGQRLGGDPADESEHFITCGECGQAFDMRDLGQVFHHNEPGHEPMENPGRVVAATKLLNETLKDRS